MVYPAPIVERYGVDALRYYLMREMPFGADGNLHQRGACSTRMNSDLANDLGNLVSAHSGDDRKVLRRRACPRPARSMDPDARAASSASRQLPALVEKHMNALQFSAGAGRNLEADRRLQPLYRHQLSPGCWARARRACPACRTVLYNLAECVRAVAVHIDPTMPRTPATHLRAAGRDRSGADDLGVRAEIRRPASPARWS